MRGKDIKDDIAIMSDIFGQVNLTLPSTASHPLLLDGSNQSHKESEINKEDKVSDG